MAPGGYPGSGSVGEQGQASLLLLGLLGVLLAGMLVLFGFGQALGARGKHQRAADLAAVSAAQVMADAARHEAGLLLTVTSGFRSDAEQARLFAANPDPKWVAPPGESLHRYGTELDLGPPAAYAWLEANSRRFGFIKRYEWEDWHYELPLAA